MDDILSEHPKSADASAIADYLTWDGGRFNFGVPVGLSSNAALLCFSSPAIGQVFGSTGNYAVNYDRLIASNRSDIERSGATLILRNAGFYCIVANLRIIDVVVPIVHILDASADGSTWETLSPWQPVNGHLSPSNTNRAQPPHVVLGYFPAGTRIRHRVDIATGPTRVGGSGAFALTHTSLAAIMLGSLESPAP